MDNDFKTYIYVMFTIILGLIIFLMIEDIGHSRDTGRMMVKMDNLATEMENLQGEWKEVRMEFVKKGLIPPDK